MSLCPCWCMVYDVIAVVVASSRVYTGTWIVIRTRVGSQHVAVSCLIACVLCLDFTSLLRIGCFRPYYRSRQDKDFAQIKVLDGTDETCAHDTLRESWKRLGLCAQGDAAHSNGATQPRRNGKRQVSFCLILFDLYLAIYM